jgi:hypothetical protein
MCLLGLALAACESQAIEPGTGSGGASGSASGSGGSAAAAGAGHAGGSGCSAALRQALTLVDQVSPGAVSLLGGTGGELLLYVDASTGGIGGQDNHPWVYLSLRTGTRVELTDLQALSSSAWDLALKRSTLRTNSGDSGPGVGGALQQSRAWATITLASAQGLSLPVETWFDADCTLVTDATGSVVTTFSAWSAYDETTHRLAPAPNAAYVVRGGDGALYKLAVLDYYSKPDGTTGASDGGHYKLRVAPLE